MLKRDIADKFYSFTVKQLSNEQPDRNFTDDELENIWHIIYDKINEGKSVDEIEKMCRVIAKLI